MAGKNKILVSITIIIFSVVSCADIYVDSGRIVEPIINNYYLPVENAEIDFPDVGGAAKQHSSFTGSINGFKGGYDSAYIPIVVRKHGFITKRAKTDDSSFIIVIYRVENE